MDGFGSGGTLFKARAKCKETGIWKWHFTPNDPNMDGLSGSFEVVPSRLKEKLRIHPEDPISLPMITEIGFYIWVIQDTFCSGFGA